MLTKKRMLLPVAFLLFVTLSTVSRAAQQWNTATGSWFTASNWTPSGVPNSGQSASINNGGTAQSNSGLVQAFLIDVGKNGGVGSLDLSGTNLEVESSLDIGDVEATATAGVSITSNGNASIIDAAHLRLGLAGTGDMNVGQTSATATGIASGTAGLVLQNIGMISLPGDFDLGQTSGSGSATGVGIASVTSVGTSFTIGGDLDVGQTSGSIGSNNFGTGDLMMTSVAELNVGADIDVAQTTGDGTSTGAATANLVDINNLSVSDSLDVAKIRAFNLADNQADGSIVISGGDVSIGFGVGNGSIEISRVLVSETARGRGTGVVSFIDANVDVANDVIVGELALGSTNGGNLSQATLNVIDSKLDTRDLSIANRLDNTAGSISGLLDIRRSLVVVQSLLNPAANSTIRLHIDGVNRSIGDGLPDDYSAIDADMANLDGQLAVVDQPSYSGPTVRGQQTKFDLITTLFGISGAFDSITYNGTTVNGVTYVGATGSGMDGFFVDVSQSGLALMLVNYLAIPGDANGDRVVDTEDFDIWSSNRFTTGADWSQGDFNGDTVVDLADLHIWNEFKFTSVPPLVVPEPAWPSWITWIIGWALACLRGRSSVR